MKKSVLAMLVNPRGRGEGELELEYSYTAMEEIPAGYADLYVEQNGAYVLGKVKGVAPQASVTRLESALAKERNDHRQIKTQIAALGGRKIEDVLSELDRIPELEAAATGKANDPEVIDKLVKAKLTPMERQLQQLQTENGTLKADVEGYKTREVKTKIRETVSKVATTAKLKASAVEDALMYAELHMTVDESGNVVTKEGAGVTAFLTPADWLNEMIPKRPHWVEGSAGGGSGNNNGGGHSGPNPYSHEGWNLSKQMQLWKTNQPLAKRMAEAQGVNPLNPVQPAKK